jgi:hypothetical protein
VSNPIWHPVPISDEEYANSYGPMLEMDKARCSECNALLKGGICLNACHLPARWYRDFMSEMRTVATTQKES